MNVELANLQDLLPLDEAEFLRTVKRLCELAGFPGPLSVAVVDDARIREVNARFLDHDYATDVIAFPLDEGEGEVVVSAERALAEAADRGVTPIAELTLYVAHGVLHLLGYDDHEPEDAGRMHEKTLHLLGELGCRNTIPGHEREGKEREP